jgi:hypothetical protein
LNHNFHFEVIIPKPIKKITRRIKGKKDRATSIKPIKESLSSVFHEIWSNKAGPPEKTAKKNGIRYRAIFPVNWRRTPAKKNKAPKCAHCEGFLV